MCRGYKKMIDFHSLDVYSYGARSRKSHISRCARLLFSVPVEITATCLFRKRNTYVARRRKLQINK